MPQQTDNRTPATALVSAGSLALGDLGSGNRQGLAAGHYHTKYFAYELTKQCSAHQMEKLSKSIFNATVDLNPHQIDAALFAFRSPLSRGAILADEVGLLAGNGYAAELVMLNGTNTEDPSREVHRRWVQRHEGHDCVTGSRSVDMRAALIDEFGDSASIMIATESGAEGLNLQFCCLVVNYDLPWNPQRTDKRRRLFEAQDEVDTRKEELLTEIEARLQQQVRRAEIFTIRWRIV